MSSSRLRRSKRRRKAEGDDRAWSNTLITRLLQSRESGSLRRLNSSDFTSAWQGQIGVHLRQKVVDPDLYDDLDKVFAATWIDKSRVVLGTKCNRLVEIDVEKGERRNVKMPVIKVSRPRSENRENCGIHSVSLNPSGTLLGSGGNNPCDFCVLEVPSLKPLQTCVGHINWVFGSAWINDLCFLTGSRDGTIRLWKYDPEYRTVTKSHLAIYRWHETLYGRVRDIKYHRHSATAASVGSDGLISLWTPSRPDGRREVKLGSNARLEVACLASHDTSSSALFAVGSNSHVSLIDGRSACVTCDIDAVSPNYGVRSLSFRGTGGGAGPGWLTCGDGRGRVSFFDLRKGEFLTTAESGLGVSEQSAHGALLQPACLEMAGTRGCTYLDRVMDRIGVGLRGNDTGIQDLVRRFLGSFGEGQPACYTHCWDQTGTRLFSAGGPPYIYARGCYMSTWE